MSGRACISFIHGLGDAAGFAHTIPLYTKRGWEIGVRCTSDKELIFKAAGARIFGEPGYDAPPVVPHHWPHPGSYPSPDFQNAFESNKIGHSVGRHPMPNIGEPRTLWPELINVKLSIEPLIPQSVRDSVDKLIECLPKPLILIHPQGNSSSHAKNISDHEQFLLLHHLLDKTPGTMILLDWDDRVVKVVHHRVRHLTDDLRPLSVPELAWLMIRASLLIVIDSGPIHLAGFTDIPTIGVWRDHAPYHYVLPRKNTLNLMQNSHESFDRWRRFEFNTVVGDITGDNISNLAVKMLSPPKYLTFDNIARDVQLQNLVRKTRWHTGQLSSYIDRNVTFDIAMTHLASQLNPVMVETGTVRKEEDWGGAGFSTVLFAALFGQLGRGHLTGVELNEQNAQFARFWTQQFAKHVSIVSAHSHDFLKSYSGPPIDVFYSDSLDVDEPGYADCCLEEVKLAIPFLRDDRSLILIDDTVYTRGSWTGKGVKAVPYLLESGWSIVRSGYQCLLCRNYLPERLVLA